MIFASSVWFGQAGFILAVLALAAVLIAAFHRPAISKGRRVTDISIGRYLRALFTDEGPGHDKPTTP